MAHLTPVRDAAGGIIGLQPKGESQFTATLADTMEAVGAVEPAEQQAPPASVRSHLAMVAGGLVAALALVAGLNVLQTPTGQTPRVAPTAAPVLPSATVAPTAAPSPTSAPTALPEPPTPVVIIQQAPPVQCWTITLDVTDAHGTPIGIATGESCDSQDAARANAEARAEQVRATHEKR